MKKTAQYLMLACLVIQANLLSVSDSRTFAALSSNLYDKPSCVSDELWDELSPYFLPEDHPARPVLDQIFSQSRATLSLKSLKKAGFIDPKPRKWTHVVVTRHPDVPGIIFKIYLDAQRNFKQRTEYQQWIQRIEGALLIEQMVQVHGWEHIFKVPKKWIYPLPEEPNPPKEFIRKNFILLAEDMDILPQEENYAKWKTDWINREKIDAIYAICEELGLYDSAKPDNIPFSRDGRIAFVDTQTVNRWPVAYRKLTPFLTTTMQEYWKSLTKSKR